MRWLVFLFLLTVLLLVVACEDDVGELTPTTGTLVPTTLAPTPTNTPAPTSAPTNTLVPAPPPTTEPTATPVPPTPTSTPVPTPTNTPAPPPTNTPIPTPDLPTPTATVALSQACHPSYEVASLDPNAEDYDCIGGSGDGPLYSC
jgi:outer membrane biosynthesis protein TonB